MVKVSNRDDNPELFAELKQYAEQGHGISPT
jgi:hypothetical protein